MWVNLLRNIKYDIFQELNKRILENSQAVSCKNSQAVSCNSKGVDWNKLMLRETDIISHLFRHLDE